jgi:hypothetical protein
MAASPPSSLAHLVSPAPSSSTHQTQASRLLTPTTNTVPLLTNSNAKVLSYAYTALVPLYYYVRSSALIRDPFPTLPNDLIFLTISTSLFSVFGLPSAGSWDSGTKDAGKIIEGTAASKIGRGSIRKKGAKTVPATDRDGSGGSLQSRLMVKLQLIS